MNNERLLKKLIPLLRKNEELLDIPKKCKWNFVFHFVVQLAFALFALVRMMPDYMSDPSYPLICVVFLITILIMCISFISFFFDYIVITNQRLIVLYMTKVVSIKFEKIKAIACEYF